LWSSDDDDDVVCCIYFVRNKIESGFLLYVNVIRHATPQTAIMSSIIATAASAMSASIKELLVILQAKVTEMEAENAALKAENARLKKYEIQINAMKYGQIQQSTPLPGGFMGYGGSEWSSNAAAGK
jgi:hypothetical protein